MLSTLIYRSRLHSGFNPEQLPPLVARAQAKNESLQVTGILLFDGTHFLQVLEGPLESVDFLYQTIRLDPRHDSVVELMRDYAPRRRFNNLGMELIDLRSAQQSAVFRTPVVKRSRFFDLAGEDRVYKFIKAFIKGDWKTLVTHSTEPRDWSFIQDSRAFESITVPLTTAQPCQFALQPIVEPLEGKISSLEALIRSPDGGSPQDYFNAIPQNKLHEADLYSKAWAFALASKIGIGDHKISINLLPMSLVTVPNAVNILLEQIARNGLVPEQVIVEVTEDEVISRFDAFQVAVRELRSAGIGLAIDDFGSGFAGLSLLTRFQPDKLKIDRSIVSDIHVHGPKQAIVQAILSCCSALEISVVAEGVEKVEEWCWLEAAGVQRFQGFLFARPVLNGVPHVVWPERVL
ncbi:diguanylate phosphodiesterase [Atlantibacter subterranea]|uniref:Diguanylate phosphodiesterase n=1 Tax=Atlantibacter subterraneus TaxID=255519 RepID=A0ABU4DZE9_9ENTR|nr:diguanylate phosphodiesterase [Atlantibacter subterranea]MDV7022223.1 diguanylate phosphodiesterase [Atlantibacter subterranea]MDZ5665432.1 diguanylate phosphodiesterase [Atlantibacter hermannii]